MTDEPHKKGISSFGLKRSEDGVTGDTSLLNIEALIKLIPVAGGFLATYFGEIRRRRSTERMYSYFEYVKSRIEEIDEQKLDKVYLKSEEFAELLIQGAEQAARSTTEERIRRFANILINNCLVDAQARFRTQSIMSSVDRISDLDAFILLCYGNPKKYSLRAPNKKAAISMVRKLSEFLKLDQPNDSTIIEAIVYMDNLGLLWVNEAPTGISDEKGRERRLKEFSSFRSPLGDGVATVIAPPGFFKAESQIDYETWPEGHVNKMLVRL